MSALTDKLHARLIARYRGTPLEQFLQWWWAELRGLVPEGLRERLAIRRERLLVITGDPEWRLFRDGGEQPAEVERIRPGDENPELFRERLPGLLARFGEERPPTVLCLPAGSALHKNLTLPGAAEENLREVLAYEMDRHTPFPADRVHFDYVITGRDPQTRALAVELVVTPRERLGRALEQADRFGLILDGVDVLRTDGDHPETMGVNLLPKDRRAKRSHFWLRLNSALGAGAVLLLALAMWQSLALKDQRIEALEAKIAEARDQAMAVASLREELDQAVRSANFLVRKKEEHPVLLNVVREVTRLLPDDTWLHRLQLDGQEVQLYGESPAASKLIGILDESPLLTQANFISPVTTNTQTGDERFNLRANIVTDGSKSARPEESEEDSGAVAASSR